MNPRCHVRDFCTDILGDPDRARFRGQSHQQLIRCDIIKSNERRSAIIAPSHTTSVDNCNHHPVSAARVKVSYGDLSVWTLSKAGPGQLALEVEDNIMTLYKFDDDLYPQHTGTRVDHYPLLRSKNYGNGRGHTQLPTQNPGM